jgi:hypothetical protein
MLSSFFFEDMFIDFNYEIFGGILGVIGDDLKNLK